MPAPARYLILAVAIALHLGVGYLIVISGLGTPEWAVLIMLAAWGLLVGQFVAITRRRQSPWLYLAIPAAAALLLVLVVAGLGLLLDWTA